MIGFPLAFAQPLLLTGLIALPVLWWILRVMPPRPRRVAFPPTRLLLDIPPREETPARTPWWLTLLRLTAAALVIIAAAGPIYNPPSVGTAATGPLVILMDDGWSAATSWEMRVRAADELIAAADAKGRSVALVPLSETTRDLTLMPAATARVALRQMSPKPFAVDRVETLQPLGRLLTSAGEAELAWLTDGVDNGRGGEFVDGLAKIAQGRNLTIFDSGAIPPHALAAAENAAARMSVKVLRPTAGGIDTGTVRALDGRGSFLGEAKFSFGVSDIEADAGFDLPVELRNDVTRLEIAGERSAGAVQLLDKRWRRRAVGVVSSSTTDTAQPLLASTFYLSRALGPFADVRLGERTAPAVAIAQFLDQKVPMIVLADVGTLAPELREKLRTWVQQGGVLVRFAGPRLAAADDDLVPVKLRRGGRSLGGSLTWEKPQNLAAFTPDGPFAGLTVPTDVTVTRQVLAEPDTSLPGKTWASLVDGTPLVTGERSGKGVIALFHVSADTRWSDLPVSGAFVEMLRRIIDLSGYTQNAGPGPEGERAASTVTPSRILDGFGAFGPPPSTAKPLPADYSDRGTAEHPPGFYGPPEGPLAVNALAPSDRIAALDTSGLRAVHTAYRNAEPRDLRGILLSIALGLFLLDAIIVAIFGGGLAALLRRRAVAAVWAALALGTVLAWPAPGQAQSLRLPLQTQPSFNLPLPNQPSSGSDAPEKIVSQTRLAYVVTGNADVDSIVKAGLAGLTQFLASHSALEPGDPVGVDPTRDELAYYPLLYWPIVPGVPKPPAAAIERLENYMKQGGTVLFDTRDAIEANGGNIAQTPGNLALRDLLATLDIPELEPVPAEHVLTKTFYILRDFPGRFTTGQTWVEALPRDNDDGDSSRPARGGDGVSPIIITSNDLAGAWALRPDGQPMLPLQPGEPRQREFAFRAGVNIVMYALTGNYKTDLVHVPALLERLGQ